MDVPELTADQREELHHALLSDRRRLEESLLLSKTGSKPVDLATPIGRLSRMDAIQQQEMTKASRSTLQTKLLQVKASLDAYQKNEYGYCRACEGPIGYPRLKARPEAPFCLACQDRRDPVR